MSITAAEHRKEFERAVGLLSLLATGAQRFFAGERALEVLDGTADTVSLKSFEVLRAWRDALRVGADPTLNPDLARVALRRADAIDWVLDRVTDNDPTRRKAP